MDLLFFAFKDRKFNRRNKNFFVFLKHLGKNFRYKKIKVEERPIPRFDYKNRDNFFQY